jgi:hypothetical protein
MSPWLIHTYKKAQAGTVSAPINYNQAHVRQGLNGNKGTVVPVLDLLRFMP